MPELPEVETLCGQLKKIIVGEIVLEFRIIDHKLGGIINIAGKRVLDVTRQGKALKIHTDDGEALVLHLRMTGRLLWEPDFEDLPPHARFTALFVNGRLSCIDPRRFATLSKEILLPSRTSIENPLLDFRAEQLFAVSRGKKLTVKSFLMDQRFIAGIGNIYTCEILHEALLHPERKASSLSLQEWVRVEKAAKRILNKAVECRGTTISDWRDLFGQKGEYQNELRVYARGNLPCFSCRGIIQRISINGRGTYFCSSCQA